ncbi:prepilin-type N-terminal cleavage/methylation domain-containing protein [Myxococcus sp. MxC21-1]|uniref:PilW family protein n=1 Tax=Myxococcus sp. MxC21-1 TaxID=3041439 RepID=UPI00292CB829|nr:prepilin-type N-terminal cleavage/methylation domain-containing protein [Myxococcus sp. MxC21-1]WNZ62651.1 prepilin-type N-terminal cleavage/methylation domain-containing protein [Myxococcus sp. MxC21-1]
MKRSSMRIQRRARRGFTLLEVMIASTIGLIVLGAGLVAAMQMQRRALFEEQTMLAQVTGRTVKELIAADLQRAGAGMGNSRITFHDMRVQTAIQVWTEPDLATADATRPFPEDPGFALPPAGPLEESVSDVLQLHWGDTRGMVTMAPCGGPPPPATGTARSGVQGFCTSMNPSTRLQPTTTPWVPAFVVNPNKDIACHVRVTNVDTGSNVITAEPGFGTDNTNNGPCAEPADSRWSVNDPRQDTWRIMQAQSATYRVNWASGTPTLEYLGPGAANWVVLSRDVERLTVRLGVAAIAEPFGGMRWFPDRENGRLFSLDECTIDTCPIEVHPSEPGAPGTDEELRLRLRQRIREVEVTLVVRTPRPDRQAFDPDGPIRVDAEEFPIDGFKRRTFTFRVTLRNFAAGSLQPRLTEN